MKVDSEIYRSVKGCLRISTPFLMCKPEWGSDRPGYRHRLRNEAAQRIRSILSPAESDQAALKPRFAPVPLRGGMSISHCPGMGGFIFHPDHENIGLDIEVCDRLEPKTLARVSDGMELIHSPGPAQLWTAKEAVYKSLTPRLQPKVISKIRVLNWHTLDESNWSFQDIEIIGKGKFSGVGLCTKYRQFCLTFFVLTQLRSRSADKLSEQKAGNRWEQKEDWPQGTK